MIDRKARELLYRLADIVENLELVQPHLRDVVLTDLTLLRSDLMEAKLEETDEQET